MADLIEGADEQDATARIVEWLADNLESGGEFVQEQAPEVVQELVQWNLFFYAMGAVFWVIVSIALLALAWSGYKEWKREKNDAESEYSKRDLENLLGFELALGVLGGSLWIPAGTCLILAAKWWIAPKVCVLQYLSSLL